MKYMKIIARALVACIALGGLPAVAMKPGQKKPMKLNAAAAQAEARKLLQQDVLHKSPAEFADWTVKVENLISQAGPLSASTQRLSDALADKRNEYLVMKMGKGSRMVNKAFQKAFGDLLMLGVNRSTIDQGGAANLDATAVQNTLDDIRVAIAAISPAEFAKLLNAYATSLESTRQKSIEQALQIQRDTTLYTNLAGPAAFPTLSTDNLNAKPRVLALGLQELADAGILSAAQTKEIASIASKTLDDVDASTLNYLNPFVVVANQSLEQAIQFLQKNKNNLTANSIKGNLVNFDQAGISQLPNTWMDLALVLIRTDVTVAPEINGYIQNIATELKQFAADPADNPRIAREYATLNRNIIALMNNAVKYINLVIDVLTVLANKDATSANEVVQFVNANAPFNFGTFVKTIIGIKDNVINSNLLTDASNAQLPKDEYFADVATKLGNIEQAAQDTVANAPAPAQNP